MKKQQLLFIVFIILSEHNYPQEFIYELSADDKNVVFESLKVRKEKLIGRIISVQDSVITPQSYTIHHFDSAGFVIRKDISRFSFNSTKSITEYKRNKKGLWTEIKSNGMLTALREYDNSEKLIIEKRYVRDDSYSTTFFSYDAFGNRSETITHYPSGRIDTTSLTFYNYDCSFTPPKIRSDTNYFNDNYKQKLITEYDSLGRGFKLITETFFDQSIDSVFYYYNEKNLIDSTVRYNGSITVRFIREYDEHWRLTKTIWHDYIRSVEQSGKINYDDTIFFLIDSIYKSKNLDLIIESGYDMVGIKSSQSYTGNELRNQYTIQYYPNGLIKKESRINYPFDKIEEKIYEYEFY
jgi:hypothetical protein